MSAHIPPRRVLQGRYIRLEPLTEADLPELYQSLGNREVFAGGWGGGPAAFQETLDDFVVWGHTGFRWDTNVYGARLQSGPDAGTLVGTSTLGDFDEVSEHAHIGWTAWDPRTWGTAVNPEAKLMMLAEAFDHGFGRVKLQADERNARSRAAIAKLGAQFEGIVRRDKQRADGSWRDTAVFAVILDDWPDVRSGLEARLAAFGGTPVTLSAVDPVPAAPAP